METTVLDHFRQHYEACSGALFGMVLRSLNGDLAASEQVLYAAFLQAMQECELPSDPVAFFGLMFRLVKIKIREQQAQQLAPLGLEMEREFRRASGHSIALQVESGKTRPKPEHLSVLELTYDQNYSIDEAAEIMGVDRITVQKQLRKGILSLSRGSKK